MTRAPLDPLHNPGAPIALSIAGHELVAFSVSAVSSYVLAPAMDCCFDLGHCPLEASHLRNVLLSHVHQDHSLGALRHRALREMRGESPSRIALPEESREDFIALVRALEKLERREPDPDLEARVHGLKPGDVHALGSRRRARVFDVTHRIASRGYTVVEERRTLRAEYRGLPGPEIAAARERGEDIHELHEQRLLTYIGDSTIETLERVEDFGDCDVLFLESTYVGDTDVAVGRKYGHTHLNELRELFLSRPERFGRAHIVLKHWSTRYRREDILAAVRTLPGAFAERITVLC
jgi:ribonuclease Z